MITKIQNLSKVEIRLEVQLNLFCFVFSCIRTEYEDSGNSHKSSNSVEIRKNMESKTFVYYLVVKSSCFQGPLQIVLPKFFRWSVGDGQPAEDSGLSYVNTSELVSILLKDYNKNTLPVRDKKPLEVSIQMFIEDMIPLEKSNMVRKTSDR